MKMRMFTMLCALSFSAAATFAQTGAQSGTRFGHGEDSLRCLQNISIYSEYVKTDNFKDAYKPWKAVFTEAPIARVSTYTDGAKILRALIAGSKDAAQQKTYLDELMAVHDQRIKYLDCPDNGDGRAEKGVCDGRKCNYTRNPHDDGRNTGRGGQEPRRNVPPLLFYSRTGRQIHPLYDGKSDVPGR